MTPVPARRSLLPGPAGPGRAAAAPDAGSGDGCHRWSMSENTSSTEPAEQPSEQPYDPAQDPDADPANLTSRQPAEQPDQAEGADDPAETQG